MLRILFACLGCATLIAATSLSSSLFIFINLPSLIFVLLLPLFCTLTYHHPSELGKAIYAALIQDSIDDKVTISHQQVLSTLRLSTSASGVIGSLIGFIGMLANMDDPKSIGPSMAVALLSALYAVILSEVLIAPMVNRLRQSSNEYAMNPEPLKPTVITLVSIPIVLVMFTIILILLPT